MYSPVRILKPEILTDLDGELLHAMDEYPPRTKFKAGDLATLSRIPQHLRMKLMRQGVKTLPVFWKIRFVISRWAHEVHTIAQHWGHQLQGYDDICRILDSASNTTPKEWSAPMIYAHGYPHGMYPNSACWFPDGALKRVTLAEQNADWPVILDEAQTQFMGWDADELRVPFMLDLAPDLYGGGQNLSRPFHHEEATFQTAAIMGLDEIMVAPVSIHRVGDPHILDPDHDAYQ